MTIIEPSSEARVAVLVDCDNVTPDILDFALRVVAQFGRVTVRRGYGNHSTLAQKWQEALVRLAFTPCLQYQYSAGKNTSDIALALDAIEALFDQRADTFCLVTSDSDFSFLCRKLRERGATVLIVGESKSPDALRNASDKFFEWTPVERTSATEGTGALELGNGPTKVINHSRPKGRPKSVVSAVKLLAAETPDGHVHLGGLGTYLRRTDPAFSPQAYGHSGLLSMLKTYELLTLRQESSGNWTVALAAQP